MNSPANNAHAHLRRPAGGRLEGAGGVEPEIANHVQSTPMSGYTGTASTTTSTKHLDYTTNGPNT
jgi:hypothetical protein